MLRIALIRSAGESARNLATSSRITSVSLGNLTGMSMIVSFIVAASLTIIFYHDGKKVGRAFQPDLRADLRSHIRRGTSTRAPISGFWIDSCIQK